MTEGSKSYFSDNFKVRSRCGIFSSAYHVLAFQKGTIQNIVPMKNCVLLSKLWSLVSCPKGQCIHNATDFSFIFGYHDLLSGLIQNLISDTKRHYASLVALSRCVISLEILDFSTRGKNRQKCTEEPDFLVMQQTSIQTIMMIWSNNCTLKSNFCGRPVK